jgi:hypothetical protein
MSAEFWAIIGVGVALLWALSGIERVLTKKLDGIQAELSYQNRERRKLDKMTDYPSLPHD